MPAKISADSPSVLVLDKSFRVLDCFSTDHPKMQISEIRQLTGLPATTVARIVRALAEANLLHRDGDDYRIGLRVLAWTASATAGSDLIAAAAPTIANLRDITGETAGVYVRQGSTRVGVSVELSRQSIMYRGHVGQVVPLHAGAAGKIFMAFDAEAFTLAFEAGLDSFTSATITNRSVLEEELEQIRGQGWAFAQGEREVGLSSLAAPVYDLSGSLVATLAIGGPSFRLTPKSAAKTGAQVAAAAFSLSQRLGFTGDHPAPLVNGTFTEHQDDSSDSLAVRAGGNR